MSRNKFYAAIAALILGLSLAAHWAAAAMHWDFKLTYLAFMLAMLVGMSAFAWWRERKFARQLDNLPAEERTAIKSLSIEARVASSKVPAGSSLFTVTVGVCLVNLPALVLMVAPLLVLQKALSLEAPLPHLLALLVGFVMAWVWWSVLVTWWRRWAESRGMSHEEVQLRGQRASILWPPGHLFEHTEWANIRKRLSSSKEGA